MVEKSKYLLFSTRHRGHRGRLYPAPVFWRQHGHPQDWRDVRLDTVLSHARRPLLLQLHRRRHCPGHQDAMASVERERGEN